MEKVCEVSDVPAGAVKGFTVQYKYILLAHLDGKFYAVDAICPHMGGYLPIGKLEGNLLSCPVHGSQYDLTTGKLVKDVSTIIRLTTGRGSRDLTTYKAIVEEGTVFIEF